MSVRETWGVRLPNSGPFAEAPILLDLATLAESLGYDKVWVHDHISWPRDKLTHFATGSIEACTDQDPNFYESIATAAFLLGRLKQIEVGIAGLVLPLRDPRVLGKQLAAIDRLSDSRFTAAVGIGAIPGDFDVMGVPFQRRGAITNDVIAALRAVLYDPSPVDFDSDSLSFGGGTFFPRPNDLDLWVTGSSDAGLRRAVDFGDGWLTVYQSVDEFRALARRLAVLAEQSDRDPGEIEHAYETYVCVGSTTGEAASIAGLSLLNKFKSLDRGMAVCLIGDANEVLRRIAEYRDAGAHHIELKFIAHDIRQLHWMIEELASARGEESGGTD